MIPLIFSVVVISLLALSGLIFGIGYSMNHTPKNRVSKSVAALFVLYSVTIGLMGTALLRYYGLI